MAKPPSVAMNPKVLSPEGIERAIGRLEQRIEELLSFDVTRVPEGSSPELSALSTAIRDTLDRAFGEGTARFHRFADATDLQFRAMVMTDTYPQQRHYQDGARKKIQQSVALLREAQRTLREDLTDAEAEPAATPPAPRGHLGAKKVFVVHGHDEAARESVARLLERLGLEPIILHERANKGRTIIEKIEAEHDAGFAVVLLTPDDVGGLAGKDMRPRARQNVLLELGYFIGSIGRSRVCALKKGEVDLPSDFAGVVWETMDEGGAWKQALGRELQEAGYTIDWNVVMRR